jgi:PAS domain S-box-containing protein
MDTSNENILKAAFAVTEEGLCLLDPADRVLEANARWWELLELRADEVLGRELWDFLPEESRGVKRLHDEARRGSAVAIPEQRWSMAGRDVRFRGRAAPVKLASGTGLLVSAVEVGVGRPASSPLDASQHELIASLRSRESLLQNALNGMTEGFQFVGRDWRYLYVNDAVARHGRHRPEELIGRTMMEVYPGIESTPLFSALRQCAEDGRSIRFENEFVYADGTSAWFDLRVQPRPEGLLILSIDVTERRRDADALGLVRDELRAIVEACKIPIIVVDLAACVTLWSKAAERVFGWSAAEVLGRPVPCIPEDKLEEVARFRDTIPAGGSIDNLVTERCDRTGRRIPVSVSTAPLRAAAGEVTGTVIVLYDLRESVALRDALILSEQRFKATFEASPTPKLLMRVSDRSIVEVNRAFIDVYEISRERLVGPKTGPILADLDGYAQFWTAVSRGERMTEIAFPFRTRSGREGQALVSGERIVVGSEAFVLIVVQDVTERRRAEQALHESHERFRQLTETIREVFWITDVAKTQLVYASPAYEQIWGRSVSELYAAPQTWTDAIHADDRERVRTAAATKQAEGTYDEEYRVVRPDGTSLWVRDRAFPVRNTEGEVIGIAGTAEDVSDRRRLEAQLHQSQKMEALGRLAGGIAHDFNNLLSVIRSYAAIAVEGLNPHDPLRADIEEIENAGRRATELTGQLLAFSRQQIVQPKVIDLNQALAGMDVMLRRILGEDVELRVFWGPSLWPVRADRGQLEQVVMNLAVNARDAMPDGGQLTIETANLVVEPEYARLHPAAKVGQHVVLAVSDTGTGMDRTVQAKIFEPFFTTKEVGKGTGLGLSTVLGMVEQSGGSIEVYSEVGVGTAFKLFFPRAEHAPDPIVSRASVIGPSGRKGETILLVEDEPQLRRLAETILKRSRYQVLVAPDPAEALALSERFEGTVHLLLTDVVMPGMNGRQLAERLRAARPDLKVLFMSGYTANVVFPQSAGTEPALQFVQKPITPTSLTRAVRSALDT